MIAAVVLAAGLSTRMGRPKQTLSVKGKAMLEWVLEVLRESKVDTTVVVLGARAAQVKERVRFMDERIIVNPDFRKGMGSSLRIGLASIEHEADAALVVLGDQPFLSTRTVDRLVEAYKATKAPVVVPVYHKRRGNPVLFDRSLFPQVMKIKGDSGAKSVVRANEGRLREVAVDDIGVLADIDRPSDLKAALRASSKEHKKTRGRTSLSHDSRLQDA